MLKDLICSDSILLGVYFMESTINESNFTNTKFILNPWENPKDIIHCESNCSEFVCGEPHVNSWDLPCQDYQLQLQKNLPVYKKKVYDGFKIYR